MHYYYTCKYNIATVIKRNPLIALIKKLEKQVLDGDANWYIITEQEAMYLIPGIMNILYMTDAELIAYIGGTYLYNLSLKGIKDNEYGANFELLIHSNQININLWRSQTAANKNQFANLKENIQQRQKFRNIQKTINYNAYKNNNEPVVLKIINIIINKNSKQKTYDQYWSCDGYKYAELILPEDNSNDTDYSLPSTLPPSPKQYNIQYSGPTPAAIELEQSKMCKDIAYLDKRLGFPIVKLFSLCSCSYGKYAIGICYHRAMGLQFLHKILQGKDIAKFVNQRINA